MGCRNWTSHTTNRFLFPPLRVPFHAKCIYNVCPCMGCQQSIIGKYCLQPSIGLWTDKLASLHRPEVNGCMMLNTNYAVLMSCTFIYSVSYAAKIWPSYQDFDVRHRFHLRDQILVFLLLYWFHAAGLQSESVVFERSNTEDLLNTIHSEWLFSSVVFIGWGTLTSRESDGCEILFSGWLRQYFANWVLTCGFRVSGVALCRRNLQLC